MSDEPEAEMADEPADDEEPVATDKDTTEDESEVEGLGEGDFVTLAYTARTAEDGTLVDTTDQETAEEEGVAEEDQTFEPRTIVLGAGHIFEAVEDAIIGSEIGDSGEVTIPAADAFGEYDEEAVRTVSAEKLPEDERYPGAHVDIDGEHGHVVSVIGGRARVDFNHPLAGEDVVYEFEVVGEVDEPVERARALLSMYVDADLEMWIETDEVEEEVLVEADEADDGEEGDKGDAGDKDADADQDDAEGEADEPTEPETEVQTVEKETLYVESTPQLSFNQQWMFQKQQIAQDVMDRLDLDRVIIQETIDGSGGMMGGMGGMMGGMGGMGGGLEELEDELEDADEEGEIDAAELVEELEAEDGDE